MRLWQIIVEAARTSPVQAFGVFYDTPAHWPNLTPIASAPVCVQGLALRWLGKLDQNLLGSELHTIMRETFPRLAATTAKCPVCEHEDVLLGSQGKLISHINNTHRWTFGEIAEWLRPIEDPIQP